MAGATIIRHDSNLGYGAAVRRLIKEAKYRNPDAMVLLDADGQHNPDEIPAMLQPVSQGFDLVVGIRIKQKARIPLYRRIGQRMILLSTRMASDSRLSDTECGFRVFSRNAMSVLELKKNGMAVSAETVVEADSKALKITEVPVTVTYSRDSSTPNPFAHGMGVIARIIAMVSERRPLFFFEVAGAILATLGLIAGIFTLRLLSSTGVMPIGTALLSVLFLIVGVFSIFSGIILHALAIRKG
jgi:glycosyltransferase involved in cell wall biosynthesis